MVHGQLLFFVVLYLLVSIGIGVYAAKFVKTSADYAIAGRHLPIYMVIATTFGTWFGSETVLGIPARFIAEGGNLGAIIEDPFGAALCLVLVGVFFAAPLYKLKLLSIGDYFRLRYNRPIEILLSLFIAASYLGWLAAQLKALGLILSLLTGGVVSEEVAIVIATGLVLIYTLFGGMWSVAISDFLQLSIIVVGLLVISVMVTDKAGGFTTVMAHAQANNKLDFWPKMEAKEILWFFGAWITMMLGSIPQQDVYQRVMSAKSASVAKWGASIGGVMYFLFAFVPMYIAYSALVIDPAGTAKLVGSDVQSQWVLPTLILNHTPLIAQILFFGALLSAIKGAASASLLAPSVTIAENIIKPFMPRMGDRQELWLMRGVAVIFGAVVCVIAMASKSSIYEMVGSAYKITLVGAFIPLLAGLFWKRASSWGAAFAIALGCTTWLGMERYAPDWVAPPQLAGVCMAALGMVVGSLFWPHKSYRLLGDEGDAADAELPGAGAHPSHHAGKEPPVAH